MRDGLEENLWSGGGQRRPRLRALSSRLPLSASASPPTPLPSLPPPQNSPGTADLTCLYAHSGRRVVKVVGTPADQAFVEAGAATASAVRAVLESTPASTNASKRDLRKAAVLARTRRCSWAAPREAKEAMAEVGGACRGWGTAENRRRETEMRVGTVLSHSCIFKVRNPRQTCGQWGPSGCPTSLASPPSAPHVV